jgi:hypothetical protein
VLALATWLPVPLLIAANANEDVVLAQLCFFVALSTVSCWHDFARRPMLLHNQVEPFVRRGRVATLIGRAFYPGWPGALLFFLVVQTLTIASSFWLMVQPATINQLLPFASADKDVVRAIAAFFMAGAALLTPPLLLGRRLGARMPLVEQLLVLLAGAIVALISAQVLDIYYRELGHYLWFALFPPTGVWAIISAGNELVGGWMVPALLAFAVAVGLMLARASPHWRRLGELEREIRAGVVEPVLPAVAAKT